MPFSSKIIEQAVEAFTGLPGVGRKTALRYVLHVIKQQEAEAHQLSDLIIKLKNDLKFCNICHNISEQHTCEICANPSRSNALICVVQDYRDVLAIESTGLYKGLYHVLGGLISPIEGVGPANLNISSLLQRLTADTQEVILALNATMEGETTSFYISRKLANADIHISTIARGIAVGEELQYADEVTLGRSITNRVPLDTVLKRT
ncbi:MAG: recombination protein RecR [Bacteroidetes bacterium]|nr:recombination protein RecR [Bacteroidota bacterium]